VVETMRPLPVASLAGVPAFVLGLSVIRGTTTPVVDTGILLGLDEPPAPKRFVTLRTGRSCVAITVESVDGIVRMDGAALKGLPPLLQTGSALIGAIGMLDREFLLVIQAAHIIPESARQAIEAGQAP
jgi:chemotaxis signal transduction protein